MNIFDTIVTRAASVASRAAAEQLAKKNNTIDEKYLNFLNNLFRKEQDAKDVDTKTFGYNTTYMRSSPTLENAPETVGVNSSIIESVARSHNLVDRINADWYNKFSRTGILDPFTANTTTKEYIFITKPDLHLFDTTGNPNSELTRRSSFFADALVRYPEVAKQLQFSYYGPSKGPFMPLLSNAYSGHVEMPTINANTYETANNVYGTHINYRGSSYESDLQSEVSLDFKDNKYLEVYMLFKMYDEYERMKWMGLVSPPSDLYIYRKILHDQMTLYKIVVGDDGMTIRYWARYVGGTVLNVPRDYFSEPPEGDISFSTNWSFNFVSDMDPLILTDFNRITSRHRQGKSMVPLYDIDNHISSPVWPLSPAIYVNQGTNKFDRYNKYFLVWVN